MTSANCPREMMYTSYNDGNENYATLVLRSSHDVEQLALPVQQVIQGMDHDLPVSRRPHYESTAGQIHA